MTSESSAGKKNFDDVSVEKMKHYFKVELDNHDILLKYLNHRKKAAYHADDI